MSNVIILSSNANHIKQKERFLVMKFFTVSFFGHRELYDIRKLDEFLTPILKKILQTMDYTTFLIGRNGEFDEYVASLIKRTRNELKIHNSELTLVLPYSVKDIEYYEEYYDGIVVPAELHGAHPKSAITLKNRWMVERSDLVIVNVERENGGAYNAMQHAIKMRKRVINIVTL